MLTHKFDLNYSNMLLLFFFCICCCCCCLPDPFRGMGAWWKTSEPQKPGNSRRTRGRRETESPKSERRKEFVAGQCRMRWDVSWDECPQALQQGFSILPILERQEPNRRLCPLQRRRERTQRVWRGRTSFSVEIEGTCVSKNLDETVRLQFEKREEWMREIRETTRDCGGRKWRIPSGHFISRVVSREKRVSGIPL